MKTKGIDLLLLCIIALILSGGVQAEQINGSETVFSSYDIRNFGAVGDGVTLNSSAIQAAVVWKSLPASG